MAETHSQRLRGLQDLIRVLRRSWLPVALSIALAVAIAVVLSASRTSQYTASATLLFRDPQLAQKLFATSFVDPTRDPQRDAATNLQLVQQPSVASRTATRLGAPWTENSVRAHIQAKGRGQADLVSISATTTDRRMSALLANTYAREFIAGRLMADRSKIDQARAVVARQLATLSPEPTDQQQRRDLQERTEQLRVFAALQTGNAELVTQAQPPSRRSSPRPVRVGILAAVLMTILATVAAFLRDRLDQTIRDSADVESRLAVPVLTVVPAHPNLRMGARVTNDALESFRTLRARLRFFNVDRDIKTVMCVSYKSGEGKSTTARNLAIAASTTGDSRIALLDLDLRRPTVAQSLALRSSPGLAEWLSDASLSLDDIAVSTNDPPDLPGAFDVIPAGAVPPNPAELLASKRMKLVLRQLSEKYDMVIMDTPPLNLVSDVVPLISEVDGVVTVVRLNASARDDVDRLHRTLTQVGANVLGVVVNDARQRAGYGYGYGYASDRSPLGFAGTNR